MDQIREILNEQSDQDLEKVEFKDDVLLEEYGIDSMGMVSMAFDLDDLINIELDDSALEKMRTLGDIKALLSTHGVTVS